MPVEPNSFSRFNDTKPIIFRGEETFGITKKRQFIRDLPPEDVGYFTVDSTNAGRLDLIASELYGSPFYAWTILDVNHVKDAIGWPKIGQTILVVPSSIVLANL